MSESPETSLGALTRSSFGHGWSSLFNPTVRLVDPTTAELVDGSCTAWSYTNPDPDTGLYDTPAGAISSLKLTSSWLQTYPDGTQLHYGRTNIGWLAFTRIGWEMLNLEGWLTMGLSGFGDGIFGRLDRITKPDGRIWTLTHNDTQLTAITDPTAGRTTYVYDTGGMIRNILDPAGRTTTFLVSPAGDLTTMISAELCVTAYAYDQYHRMTAFVNPCCSTSSRPGFMSMQRAGRAGPFATHTRPTGPIASSTRFGPFGSP